MEIVTLDEQVRESARKALRKEIDLAFKEVKQLAFYCQMLPVDVKPGDRYIAIVEAMKVALFDYHKAKREQHAVESFVREVASMRTKLDSLVEEAAIDAAVEEAAIEKAIEEAAIDADEMRRQE